MGVADLVLADLGVADLVVTDLVNADLAAADWAVADLAVADFVTCADWGVCGVPTECPEGTGLCVTPRRASETRGVVPCLRP